jgi:hypothetical protein
MSNFKINDVILTNEYNFDDKYYENIDSIKEFLDEKR